MTRRTPEPVKQRIISVADALMQDRFQDWYDLPGSCLPWACCAVIAGVEEGLNITLQAGTSFWICDEELDDQGQPNAFGYLWDPSSPLNVIAESMGQLPEMHVWAGIIDTQEIVDLASGQFPTKAREAGIAWRAPRPPDHFWGKASDTKGLARYEPNRDATLYAIRRWKQLLRMAQRKK